MYPSEPLKAWIGPSHYSNLFISDWNELMNVVVKIENLKLDESFLYSVDTGRDFCIIETNDFAHHRIAVNSIPNDKKQSVYLAVVGFIKWYNKNKK